MSDSKIPLHDRDALMAAVAGKYPLATTTVDGRSVGEPIANTGSIRATLDDYEVLAGVREVPMTAFDQLDGPVTFASATEQARTMALAEAIRQSGRIDPLIVVEDGEGPYVLEGGHRFDALRLLGARSFPAKVVLDMAALVENGVHALDGAGLAATPGPVDGTSGSAVAQEFDRWFGASQLVDMDGKPLMLFHGSNRVFDALAPSATGNMGSGWYLTTSAHAANVFADRATVLNGSGGRVSIPFYVRAENLLNLDVLKPSDIENLRRAIPRTAAGLEVYGVDLGVTDLQFWQADLDKIHAALDRQQFSPAQLSGVFLGTGQEVEVLGRIYAAAGYDAVGRTSDAFQTQGAFFEVIVYDASHVRFAIPAMAERGNRRHPPPKHVPCTYYGTIEAKESDRMLLEAMGVEVWRYDQNGGRFYVCYAPEVHAVLQEHTSDFRVSATAVPRVAEVTVFSADLGTPAWLAARQALLEWRRVGAPDVLDYIYADEIAAIDAARHPSQSRHRPASSAENDRPSVC